MDNYKAKKLTKDVVSAVSYYLTLGLCRFLAIFPVCFLYFFSDICAPFLYHVIRYRRGVVRDNLQKSFPEKSKSELKAIERKFYRHLTDFFVEYLVLFKLSSEQLGKRLEYKNCQIVEKLYDKGKDPILIMGHYGNWELFSHFATKTRFSLCPIYKEQKNPYFDKFVVYLRSKNKAVPIEMKNAFRHAYTNKKANIRTMLILIADQSPTDTKFFTNFLNHPGTPVFEGPERIGKALDMAIVFGDIKKTSRGHYSVEFVLLHENPRETQPGEITELHVRYLEKMIQATPEYWLWTHRRWKRLEDDFIKNNP